MLSTSPRQKLVAWMPQNSQSCTLWVSKKQSIIILSITCQMLTDFQNLFTNRFISEYSTKLSLTISPHLKHIAALPCETSISENYWKSIVLNGCVFVVDNDACIFINDKSQGSVATHFRCGELFGNYFTTDLLLILLVKQFLKSVNIWRSYRQEVTNRPLIICRSSLLQYLFFCVTADGYSHTVEILVWPLCVSFS